MKRILSFIAAAILTSTILLSCKKDDKDNNTTPSKTPAELIAGKWSFVALTSSKTSAFDIDMAAGTGLFQDKESSCAKSSTLTFTKTGDNTGTMLIFDNCASKNYDDTWILQNNVLTKQGLTYNVAQLDNAALRLYCKGGRTGKIDPNNSSEYIWTDYTDAGI